MKSKYSKKIGIRLTFGFGIIVVLVGLLGITSIVQMNKLADVTVEMYEHPLAVSNAIWNIRTNIVAMHRSMKDVVLAKDSKELKDATRLVNEFERDALVSFDIIIERFLGDKKDIEVAKKAFIDWRPIREEVVKLMHIDKSYEAAEITKGKGKNHIAYMNDTIQEMSDFASNKAYTFFKDAQKLRDRLTFLVLCLLILIIVVSVSLGAIITRSITKPIKYIMAEMDIIAKGDLGHKINLGNEDEIGQLSDAFDKMTGDLEKTTASRDELNSTNQQYNAANQQLRAANQQLQANEQRLQKSMHQLERFNKMAVGRELRMEELRKEVDSVLTKFGQEKKYYPVSGTGSII